MVEENFRIWVSETLQIDSILIIIDNHYLIMVEEIFKIWVSEMLQIDSFLPLAEKCVKRLSYLLVICPPCW